MNKSLFKSFLLLFCAISMCFSFIDCNFFYGKVYANNSIVSISDDLQDAVNDELGNLDGSGFDDILNGLGESEKEIFNNDNFIEKIKKIISGKEGFNFSSIMSLFGSLLIDNLYNILPLLATICAIAVLSSILLQLRGKSMNKSLGDIIHFACFAVIVVAVLTGVVQLVSLTIKTLGLLKAQMEIAFPILLTLMVSLGATSSVSLYQPMIAILCGIMMQLFSNIILPIFSFSIIMNVVGNLTSSVKLSKFSKFFDSLFKYVIGFSFTIFFGFLAISGIVAGSFDGVSIRATKFMVKSYVPFVGGYLSDGFSLIMASSVLIKNAIGYSGLIIMFLTIISPILKIVFFKLGLTLVAAIIEPVADSRVTEFVSSTAKSLSMLSSIILSFSFAYLVCVGLIMCTSNVL